MTEGDLPSAIDPSIFTLMGPEILEQGDGRAVLKFTPRAEWTIGSGVVQGGIVTTMLDMAMAFAAGGLSTASITVEILRPAVGPTLIATGSVTKKGRRLLFASGELADGEGRLIARGTQTAIPIAE